MSNKLSKTINDSVYKENQNNFVLSSENLKHSKEGADAIVDDK